MRKILYLIGLLLCGCQTKGPALAEPSGKLEPGFQAPGYAEVLVRISSDRPERVSVEGALTKALALALKSQGECLSQALGSTADPVHVLADWVVPVSRGRPSMSLVSASAIAAAVGPCVKAALVDAFRTVGIAGARGSLQVKIVPPAAVVGEAQPDLPGAVREPIPWGKPTQNKGLRIFR